jgi:hypothetical protein
MSVTVADNVPVVQGANAVPESPPRALKGLIARATVSPWGWLTISFLLVGISGGIRFVRDWQFSSLAHESATCPFPLDELPTVLGNWHMVEGTEQRLDPQIEKMAGPIQHVVRHYQNQAGDVTAEVLVLYGMATSLFAHTPAVCYPVNAFKPLGTVDRAISLHGVSAPAHYELGIYAKDVGGLPRLTAASHMFLHDGVWTPDVASRWKLFRAHPGMFKIQIDREASELSTADDPAESLMVAIAEEINRRVAEKRTSSANGTTVSQATPAR